MKKIISGNEAIALGFGDFGGVFASGYPGTPSTETLEEVARLGDVYCEWAPNEKVALESAIGGSIAGGRSLSTMKHVGVNVAADALLTLTYTGVNAGLILMVSDDPGMHSSQNEQDSRNYAKFAKVPMLDPSDSQEAYEMVRAGFEISEQFDTPLMLRTTTRISHAKGVVVQQGKIAPQIGEWVKDVPKYVMLPNFGKLKHIEVEARLLKLQEFAETTPLNRIEMRDTEFGIITSGVSYQHVRESCPNASILKLGMVHPLPTQKIREFAKSVKHLVIVEEMDAIFEEQILAMGINVEIGKNKLPLCGEINADLISAALGGAVAEVTSPVAGLPQRPPVFCPSCAHRGLFTILSKLKVFVSGDIGCYTLGALPPMSAMHSVIDMGCGDGRIIIKAAQERECQGLGLEKNHNLATLARERVRSASLEHLVTIKEEDAAQCDLSGATVVFLFLPVDKLPELVAAILPKLQAGARLVAHEQSPIRAELTPEQSRPLITNAGITVAHRWVAK